MYHYEAVLRKAMEGKVFNLKEFYKTRYCGIFPVEVTVKVPKV